MIFRASFCDPFKKDVIELGEFSKDKIMDLFEGIDWEDLLHRMDKAKENEIYYSPSLEIENKDNRHGLCFSAINFTEWYIFYKRPKLRKKRKFFKVIEQVDTNYMTEIQNQTPNDVKECLKALITNNLAFLEEKIKE